MSSCQSCRLLANPALSPGGIFYDDGLWRVMHAIEPVPLLGWLIMQPIRHVEQIGDLTPDEAASLGPVARRVSAALAAELSPAKIYMALFAESSEFPHLHWHLIPRPADVPAEYRGPNVFTYMAEAFATETNHAPIEEVLKLTDRLRVRLSAP